MPLSEKISCCLLALFFLFFTGHHLSPLPAAQNNQSYSHEDLLEYIGPQLVSAEGDTVSSNILRKKPNVLLFFSASWCGPCRSFMPDLIEFYEEYYSSGQFKLLLVTSDRSEEKMLDYMQEYDMPGYAVPFAKASPRTSPLKENYGRGAIPHLLMVDDNGEIVAGRTDGSYLPARAVLQELRQQLSMTNGFDISKRPSLSKKSLTELAEGEPLNIKLLYGEHLYEALMTAADEADSSIRITMIFYNPAADTPSSRAHRFSEKLIAKAREDITVQILTTDLPRHQTIGTANRAAEKFFKETPVSFLTATPHYRIHDDTNVYISNQPGNIFYGVSILIDRKKLFMGNFVISDSDLSRPNSPAFLISGKAIEKIASALEAVFNTHFPAEDNE